MTMNELQRQYLPWHIRARSHEVFIVASVVIAVFTDTFLFGILIPVVPKAIQERCGIPPSQVQMFTSIAVGVSGAGALLGACFFGYLADHIRSRRTSLLISLVSFVGATVMIWVASHIALMIIGRFLQGVASAAVWSVGLALLVDTVGNNQVPVAMGYVNIGFSCGAVLGPLAGGLVYSIGGFHATMGLAVGLLALDIILRLLIIEKKDLPDVIKCYVDQVDTPAAAPLLGEARTRAHVRTDEEREESCAPSGSHGEAAYRTLMGSRRLVVTLCCAIVQALTMAAFEATLPIHLYDTYHYSTFMIAMVFIPLMLPAFLSPAIGSVCERVGNRPVACTGYIVCAIMMVLLRFLTHRDTAHEVLLFGELLCIGVAMCAIMTPVLAEVFSAVEDMEAEVPGRFHPYGAFAQAYALFEVFYASGQLIGPLIAGWLVTQFSWSVMTLCLGILNVLVLGLMMII